MSSSPLISLRRMFTRFIALGLLLLAAALVLAMASDGWAGGAVAALAPTGVVSLAVGMRGRRRTELLIAHPEDRRHPA